MADEVFNSMKIWLYLNHLTPNPDDYAPRVVIEKSLTIEDIINDIVASRTDLSPSTIRDVNSRIEEAIRKRLANGYAIRTGNYYVYPKASGVFAKASAPFDPAIHEINAQFTQSAGIRELLRASTVSVLGVAPVSIFIDEVLDKKTQETNGALTKGHNVIISGNEMKIGGTDERVGLYLVNAETDARIKISEDDLVRNTAKEIIILLPTDTPAGNYFLEITTQLSGSTLLKEPRTARFDKLLTISGS